MARHEVPYVLITETKDLEDLVAQWQSAAVLAVDTETAHWNQMRSGKSSISLLQIWDGQSEMIWVIDCFAADISLFIQKTMRSWETTKLIHNAPYDLAYLGGAAQAGAVVCTLQMARRIPIHLRNGLARNSLKALSEHFLDVELDKSYQASNWALRPLSKYQLAYAALDPWATYRVWEEMRALSEPEDEIVL
jgi:ribonuclease D